MNDATSAIGEANSSGESTSLAESLQDSESTLDGASTPVSTSSGQPNHPGVSSTGKVPSSSAASTASRNPSSVRSSNPASSKPTEPEPNEYVQKQFYIATFRAVHFGADEAKYTKVIKANKEAGINLIENAIFLRQTSN